MNQAKPSQAKPSQALTHCRACCHEKQGFTLIEISIALVIIGLLVAGVLVGRDLIKAAEMRAQLSDIEKVNTAVTVFGLKYDCLPGDCRNATQFFSAASQPEAVTNGDGNGIIKGYTYAPNDQPHQDGAWTGYLGLERSSVFDHLSAAGLWTGAQFDETSTASNQTGIAYPTLKIKSGGSSNPGLFPGANFGVGGIVVGHEPAYSYIPGGHKIRLGACPNPLSTANMLFYCVINPWEAYAIDSKIDDGKPFSGNTVVTQLGDYIYRIPGSTAPEMYGYCNDNNGNVLVSTQDLVDRNFYATEKTLGSYGGDPVYRTCALSIKAQF